MCITFHFTRRLKEVLRGWDLSLFLWDLISAEGVNSFVPGFGCEWHLCALTFDKAVGLSLGRKRNPESMFT